MGRAARLNPEALRRQLTTAAPGLLTQEAQKTRIIAAACYGVLARGFFGRLRWLLLGT